MRGVVEFLSSEIRRQTQSHMKSYNSLQLWLHYVPLFVSWHTCFLDLNRLSCFVSFLSFVFKLVSSSVGFATVHNSDLFMNFHLFVFLFCYLCMMYFIFDALVFSVLVSSLFCVPPARWQVLCFTVGALVETSPEGVLPHTPPLPSPLITLRDRNQQRGETESTFRMSPPHSDFDATCWNSGSKWSKAPQPNQDAAMYRREFYYACFSWNFVVMKSQRRNIKKCKIIVAKKMGGDRM